MNAPVTSSSVAPYICRTVMTSYFTSKDETKNTKSLIVLAEELQCSGELLYRM